ncbi:Lrp/AsnC family transcriptional regulator [Acinetobacter larvae]|uniref:AsnC family transcriptional regulator n=1 Tax=Acinetobacter larvae TaxID=1789224 RepID=A0A1B2LXM0_9GAMM|nr:Lrp/AsnC family transcriptional regulator [Acinetobacter larvae]AOA57503.1 AsnC family transcriptional regulator [Acinetobacter larvae]
MNNTDSQILGLLQENARISITELSQRVKVSRATIQKRISWMEMHGIIDGYTVRLKRDYEVDGIRAWMSIMVEGAKATDVVKMLRLDPAVQSLHSTNGKWDLLLELKSPNLEKFDQILDRIRTIPGIYNTETNILLTPHKVRTSP